MTERLRIDVMPNGSMWVARCGHCSTEHFFTQERAIAWARQHVAARPEGSLSQILVHNAQGQYRAEWTYGKDPYPPKG